MGAAVSSFVLHARAKLNRGLEVLGRRLDGYHDLLPICQAIGLHDRLTFAPARELSLRVVPAPGTEVPGGEEKLVLRAARALAARKACPARTAPGAALTLEKAIPVAAGLGGGSSDAAAALLGLRRLWGLDLPDTELARLAAGLGADVPFFLRGGTALATGIGDRLAPLPALSGTWFVTLTPPLPVPPDKTRRLYAALAAGDYGDGARTRAQAERLRRGEPLDPGLLVNSFDRPLTRLYPELAAWRSCFLDAGAPWALPSGSGPTLFTALPAEGAARAVAAALAGSGAQVHVAPAAGPVGTEEG